MKQIIFRNYIPNIVVFSFVCLLASYTTQASDANKSDTAKSVEVFDADRQELAALAFISYAGEKLELNDSEIEQILPTCIRNEIQRQAITKGKYQLVWGPSVYRFPFAKLDDNMMYIVRDTSNQNNLVIALRGTNGGATLDWMAEDYYVNKTKAWSYGNNMPANTLISEATHIGLSILQKLKSKSVTTPGYNTTVIQYLNALVRDGSLDQVTVVGHSLAGALAPTYALWLKDIQSTWDPTGNVQIKVTALAGATPGNKQFSDYYGRRLGNQTDRVHNPYDAVPQVWYLPTLKQLPYLYSSAGIPVATADKLIIDFSVELAKGTSYTQILPQQSALPGKINTASTYKTFISQVGWQHTCGYYCALGMAPSMLKTNSYCVTEMFCKRNPTDPKCVALSEPNCSICP